MVHQLEAIYERDGVLRLSHPLPLADHQQVEVTVTESKEPRPQWAAVDQATGEILLYAGSVREARDRARALGRGEPLIRSIPSQPDLPSAGF